MGLLFPLLGLGVLLGASEVLVGPNTHSPWDPTCFSAPVMASLFKEKVEKKGGKEKKNLKTTNKSPQSI